MNGGESNQIVKYEDNIAKTKKQKKIKKMLKKVQFMIQVPKLICIQKYFQISETCIINESALRDPENCTESLLTNTFYFKRIGSMQITQNILQLNLKDIICPKLPINYFIDRYKSFGDVQFYNMSLVFQRLSKQFSLLSTKQKTIQSIPNKQYFLNFVYDYLETIKDKTFFCFYYEPNQLGLTLKKFIFSKSLLQEIGLDIEQVRNDYIKYKHIFFEIFGCHAYKQIIARGTRQFAEFMENLRSGKVKLEEASQKFSFSIKSLIHRRKKVNGLIFEEEVSATIRIYKPAFFLTVIELSDIDESNVIRMYPLSKVKMIVSSQQKLQIEPENRQQLK